ncbi:MAG: flippase, partial [candidate division Zixibacteria bacterium]|nr:flippase [candidate division Zixibacteria bacterium]
LGLGLIFAIGLWMPLSPATRTLVYLIGAGNFFINCTLGWRWVFQAQQRLKFEALLLFVFGQFYALAAIILLLWQKNLAWVGVSYLGGGVITLILCFHLIKSRFRAPRFNLDFNSWGKILKGAIPIALSVVFIKIYFNADTILLNHFQGEEATGIYNASNRIIQQVRMIPALFGPAFLPALSQLAVSHRGKFEALLKKSLFYLFTLSLPVAVITTFAAGQIINLFYGVEFAESSVVLQLQIWSTLFMVLYMFVFNGFMAEKQYKTLAILSGSGAIVNLALNFVLIPAFSIRGAALSILISEVLVLGGTVWVLQNKFGFNLFAYGRKLLAPVCAGIAMTLCWLVFTDWSWVWTAIVSTGVFAVIFILLKGIPTEDRQVWKSLLFGRTKTGRLEVESEV